MISIRRPFSRGDHACLGGSELQRIASNDQPVGSAQPFPGFKSLGDAWANTTTPHGRLMLTVAWGTRRVRARALRFAISKPVCAEEKMWEELNRKGDLLLQEKVTRKRLVELFNQARRHEERIFNMLQILFRSQILRLIPPFA
jgi:hypothetical protein